MKTIAKLDEIRRIASFMLELYPTLTKKEAVEKAQVFIKHAK